VAWVGLVGGNMSAVLKEDGPRTSGGGRTARVRALLVVAETALALVLLVGAVLLMKSVGRLQQVDPGFSPDHVLTLQLALPAPRYPDAPARFAFWSRLLDRVRALPGVTAAGFTSNVPFNGSVSSGSYSIVGYTPPETEAQPHGRQEVVGGDYFRAMQIPLLQGRMFTDTDSADAPPVVVVDQLLVRRYFQDRSPIGQQIRRGGPTSPPFTIVGVVGTINSIDLGEPVTKERLYYPLAQQARPGMALVVKTAGDPGGVVAAIRSAVGAIDPEQPVADVRTLDDWIARSLGDRRSPMLVLVAFALVALALAAIGVHGVAAYGVAQRRREFGIRQALGADRRSIRMLVLRQALKYALAGAAVGLAVAWAAAGVLRSVLFGVGPRDPLVYAAVAALLLAVTAVACDRPARRAMRVDPAAALRES
jgi:predicted permease